VIGIPVLIAGPVPLAAPPIKFPLAGKKSRFGLLSTQPAGAVVENCAVAGNRRVSLINQFAPNVAAKMIDVTASGKCGQTKENAA
jgi:hypothetical protein